MKIVKNLLIGIVGLLVVLAVIGFLLPGSVRVTRSAVIAVPAAQLVPYLDGFGRFNEWSPWADLDPITRYTYSGPARGPGAHMEWHSVMRHVGSGKQQVLAVEGDRQVRWSVEFAGQGTAGFTFDLAPEGGGTRVTWNIDMDMGMNPVGRWFGLMMDGAIGPDFEKGLGRLKALAEKEAATPVTPADMIEPAAASATAGEPASAAP